MLAQAKYNTKSPLLLTIRRLAGLFRKPKRHSLWARPWIVIEGDWFTASDDATWEMRDGYFRKRDGKYLIDVQATSTNSMQSRRWMGIHPIKIYGTSLDAIVQPLLIGLHPESLFVFTHYWAIVEIDGYQYNLNGGDGSPLLPMSVLAPELTFRFSKEEVHG